MLNVCPRAQPKEVPNVRTIIVISCHIQLGLHTLDFKARESLSSVSCFIFFKFGISIWVDSLMSVRLQILKLLFKDCFVQLLQMTVHWLPQNEILVTNTDFQDLPNLLNQKVYGRLTIIPFILNNPGLFPLCVSFCLLTDF